MFSLPTSGNTTSLDPKPSVDGPTPLVNQLTIEFVDNPNRLIPGFDYPGLVEGIAETPGNYRLVGDHVGIIPIQTITFVPGVNVDGMPAVDSVILTFTEPLPDDRFTLTVFDNLVDPVGNKLDGESNGVEPLDDPLFPSGDGVPGSNFQARFTVDTRPEIGSFVAQSISIDINGNFTWDPNPPLGGDFRNVDIAFTLPVADINGVLAPGSYNVHDLLFAGKFGLGGGLIEGDNAIFVIDVSGSTSSAFGGDPVGDQNNDGAQIRFSMLEIAAFKLLNQQLIDRGIGNTAQVGIAAFASNSMIIDMDPVTAGVQLTTTPLADTNANGMRDVDELLMLFRKTGGSTNFEAGLQDAISIINGAGIANGSANVVFLSDGLPNEGGSFADEVTTIGTTFGHNLRAFGVGPGASLASLQQIDPAAITFSNTNELLAAFGGGGGVAGGAISGFDTLAAYGWSAAGIPGNATPNFPLDCGSKSRWRGQLAGW